MNLTVVCDCGRRFSLRGETWPKLRDGFDRAGWDVYSDLARPLPNGHLHARCPQCRGGLATPPAGPPPGGEGNAKTLTLVCDCGRECTFGGPTDQAVLAAIDRAGWADCPDSNQPMPNGYHRAWCPVCLATRDDASLADPT